MAYVSALPQPAPGHTRVFRGQTKDYDTMSPTGLRGGNEPGHRTFNVFTQQLASHLHDQAGSVESDLESWVIWTRAIAQHYGSGSRFLDVTKSLDVAMWFATHEARDVQVKALFGQPGPLDPVHDMPADLRGTAFDLMKSGHGYVYALDVPDWNATGPLKHGDLIDLAEAPKIFAASRRMQVQQACLVYADHSTNQGDVKSFCATDPIPVAVPITGHTLPPTTRDLFPGPAEDDWYRRLLSIPQVHCLDPDGKGLRLAQAIPTRIYIDQQTRRQTEERLIVLDPPLLWPEISRELKKDSTWLPGAFKPDGATPLLLELPIFAMTPPVDSGQWNYEVAISDLPAEVKADDVDTSRPVAVSLDKVFVEFSPLELVKWDEVETARVELVFWRGVYFERSDDDGFTLWLVNQTFPTGQLRVSGPFKYRYDRASRELVFRVADEWVASGPFLKNLVVVLTIIREFSEKPIACPFPTLSCEGLRVYVVRVQKQTAGLVRVRAPRSDEYVCLLTHPKRAAPFDASSNDAGQVVIRANEEWSKLPLRDIQRALPIAP